MTDTHQWKFEVTFRERSTLSSNVFGEDCLDAAVTGVELLQTPEHEDHTITQMQVTAHNPVAFARPNELSVLTITAESCPYLPSTPVELTETQLRLVHDEHIEALQP